MFQELFKTVVNNNVRNNVRNMGRGTLCHRHHGLPCTIDSYEVKNWQSKCVKKQKQENCFNMTLTKHELQNESNFKKEIKM